MPKKEIMEVAIVLKHMGFSGPVIVLGAKNNLFPDKRVFERLFIL